MAALFTCSHPSTTSIQNHMMYYFHTVHTYVTLKIPSKILPQFIKVEYIFNPFLKSYDTVIHA